MSQALRLHKMRNDSGLYWTLCTILGAMTAFEWFVYLDGTFPCSGEDLIPGFLMLAAVKFGMAVAWAVQIEDDPGPWRKALVVFLALSGGGLAALPILL